MITVQRGKNPDLVLLPVQLGRKAGKVSGNATILLTAKYL